MRSVIITNLGTSIDPKVVEDLVTSFEDVVTRHQKGDPEGCLTKAGKFVENVLRAIEGIRTGTAPSEIKFPVKTVKAIEADTSLPEAIRLLVPRIATAMIYDVRSKKGAAHVKEVDPKQIDAALAVHAASWIMAELLRTYHSSDDTEILDAMASLVRSQIPFIEKFGDEIAVTRVVPPEIEILLLLASAEPTGLSRTDVGRQCKMAPPKVTRTLQKLDASRHIHKTKDGLFRITGPGEKFLALNLPREFPDDE